MKYKYLYLTTFIFILVFTQNTFSQSETDSEVKVEEETEEIQIDDSAFQENDDADESEGEEVDPEKKYSIFDDFRIPVREDINESDLLYEGWKTKAGNYTFRCNKRKRVRLTFWSLDKDGMQSEFINVTEAGTKCNKKDPDYVKHSTKNKKSKKRRRKNDEEEDVENTEEDLNNEDEATNEE